MDRLEGVVSENPAAAQEGALGTLLAAGAVGRKGRPSSPTPGTRLASSGWGQTGTAWLPIPPKALPQPPLAGQLVALWGLILASLQVHESTSCPGARGHRSTRRPL